jgi:hypothetical protein
MQRYNSCVNGRQGTPKVNKLKLKRTDTSIDLSAALDRSVEAAVVLGVCETDLVALLLERFKSKTQNNQNNVVLLRQPPKKMFNPEAGP